MTKREGLKIHVQYTVKVIDTKTGKVLKTVKGKSKTFNQNFARLLGLLMFPRGDVEPAVSVTDTGGTARTMRSPSDTYPPTYYTAGVAYRLELGVGKSDVAFDRTHYNLLDPQAWVDYATFSLTDDGTKVTVEFSGSWYNDTGLTVTIQEIGFRCRFRDDAGYICAIMLARDVITATDVPAGSTIAVAYAITIPF